MPKSQRCLLGVFAHPDDETYCAAGTFARYAREGVAVYAVKALGLTLEGPEVEPTLMIDISAYKALKVRALRTYKTQEDAQRLADLFERTLWTVEAFHQAYPPVPVGVQSVGFWETARTSDPAVLMLHTRQDDAEMELEERQSQ
jgi:LmbE family N-acetylglucosaminyl deacetylase